MNRRTFIESISKGAALLLTAPNILNASLKSFSDKDIEKVLDYIYANWDRSLYKDEASSDGFG